MRRPLLREQHGQPQLAYNSRLECLGDGSVAKHVIRGCGLLDPCWLEHSELLHELDRGPHVPALVGVHHELAVGSDLFSDDLCATNVVFDVRSDLDLEVRHAFGQPLAAQLSYQHASKQRMWWLYVSALYGRGIETKIIEESHTSVFSPQANCERQIIINKSQTPFGVLLQNLFSSLGSTYDIYDLMLQQYV